MRVLVVGSGGREHALVWRLARDPRIKTLFAIPGNGGTVGLATSISAPVDRIDDLHRAVRGVRPDLVVVGPEVSLALGIADRLKEDNIPCFGPSAGAAKIETSKVFAKQLMAQNGVPTAEFYILDDFADVQDCLHQNEFREGWVVKADGLAAGKGAFVCDTPEEVLESAHALLVNDLLGEAGRRIVLERRLVGREASALFWCDGEHFVPLPAAQDYKRAHDGDHGPNTGGMGSYCPAVHVTAELRHRAAEEIIKLVIMALAVAGTPFKGILYAGLMLTEKGPQVIEFNARFGDPETQVILPSWDGDLLYTMMACVNGTLDRLSVSDEVARCGVCVVLAAEGYPGSYRKQIQLKTVPDGDSHYTFHAGTKLHGDQLLSTGGRVLNAVGTGPDLHSARANAYALAEQSWVPGLFFRNDIALTQ